VFDIPFPRIECAFLLPFLSDEERPSRNPVNGVPAPSAEQRRASRCMGFIPSFVLGGSLGTVRNIPL
jgi:hypothetical protein